MNTIVPKIHMSLVAARLAAEGHNLMTAPASLVAYALEPSPWGDPPEEWVRAFELEGRDSTNQEP